MQALPIIPNHNPISPRVECFDMDPTIEFLQLSMMRFSCHRKNWFLAEGWKKRCKKKWFIATGGVFRQSVYASGTLLVNGADRLLVAGYPELIWG